MQQVVSTPLRSVGGVPTPPNCMRTTFAPKIPDQTGGTRTLLNGQTSQFRSMFNALRLRDESWVLRIAKGKSGHKYSMEVRSMFEELRFQLNQSWKEEGFVYLHHTLLMCGIMDPSTPRSLRLACAGSQKAKYERYNNKIEVSTPLRSVGVVPTPPKLYADNFCT